MWSKKSALVLLTFRSKVSTRHNCCANWCCWCHHPFEKLRICTKASFENGASGHFLHTPVFFSVAVVVIEKQCYFVSIPKVKQICQAVSVKIYVFVPNIAIFRRKCFTSICCERLRLWFSVSCTFLTEIYQSRLFQIQITLFVGSQSL